MNTEDTPPSDVPTTVPEPPEPGTSADEKTDKPPRKNRRARRLILFGILAALVIGLIDVADSVWTFYGKSKLTADKVVVIERGSSVQKAAETLETKGVILSDRIFTLGARLHGADRNMKAGEYRVPAGATMYDIMRLLEEGKTVIRRLTVPEGMSAKQVADLLNAEPALVGVLDEGPAEGSVLPETYHISLGDDRNEILGRMTAAMEATLDELWPDRAPNLPFTTREEAVVLASIVEKETAIPAERPRIAAVFINRLERGMPLQSDPTIVYGITGGTPLGRPIRRSELDAKTPYNTYHFRGLPPTPIANPGVEAIKAVLNPLETEELYFVADGTGGHVFSKTYREHQQNVRKWRRHQRSMGTR